MHYMFSHEFDEQSNVFFLLYAGAINFKDILNSWQFSFEKRIIPKSVNGFVMDFRNATVDFQVEDYKEFTKTRSISSGGLKDIRIAVLVDSPKAVVVAMLLELEVSCYSIKPFHTKEAAVKWLLTN